MPAPHLGLRTSPARWSASVTMPAKIVILEWANDGCSFVGKHYNSGNMQALQRKYTGEGDG